MNGNGFMGGTPPGNKNESGESNPNHKLTKTQVMEIIALAKSGRMTQKEIAERYGISQSEVSQIVTTGRWGVD